MPNNASAAGSLVHEGKQACGCEVNTLSTQSSPTFKVQQSLAWGLDLVIDQVLLELADFHLLFIDDGERQCLNLGVLTML